MRLFGALIACIVLFSSIYAGQMVKFISPNAGDVSDGGTVDLGAIGPGQTVIIAIDPRVSAGGKHGIGGLYDQIVVLGVPQGWEYKNSKLYGNPIQAEVTASRDAPDGQYEIDVEIVDEYGLEELGNSKVKLLAQVKRDVMGMTVEPKSQEIGAGQPARYTITISNTGSANDIFEVSASGVRNWNFKKSIYIPSGSSKQITYEVVGDEEERYNAAIEARSASSDLIYRSESVELVVKASAASDFKAATRGLLIFPIIEGPVYYLFGLISNLF
jgi:hypothetical protein